MTVGCTNFALIKYLSQDPLHYASFTIQHIETCRESNKREVNVYTQSVVSTIVWKQTLSIAPVGNLLFEYFEKQIEHTASPFVGVYVGGSAVDQAAA